MEQTEFVAAARLVVKRNLAPAVEAAAIEWAPAERCLKLAYFSRMSHLKMTKSCASWRWESWLESFRKY